MAGAAAALSELRPLVSQGCLALRSTGFRGERPSPPRRPFFVLRSGPRGGDAGACGRHARPCASAPAFSSPSPPPFWAWACAASSRSRPWTRNTARWCGPTTPRRGPDRSAGSGQQHGGNARAVLTSYWRARRGTMPRCQGIDHGTGTLRLSRPGATLSRSVGPGGVCLNPERPVRAGAPSPDAVTP